MIELARHEGLLRPSDAKTYRRHLFVVPEGASGLVLSFSYDPGQQFPHSLLTLSLFDPAGFRGAGHRYAPHQVVRLGHDQATPGFLPGPLAAGEWCAEVDVHRVIGRPDGAPNRYALTVEAESESGPREPAPLPPTAASGVPGGVAAGRRWLRGELHLHTSHSDGLWSPAEMAGAALGRGLDFMALTDHNTVSGIAALREATGAGTLVIPGLEITTYRGHGLALGVEGWLDWRTGLEGRWINDVARQTREAGGVFIVAHPDAPPDEVCTGCRWTYTDFDPALADGVEVWGGLWDGPEEENEGCLAFWRAWLDAGHRLAATGATDAHGPKDWAGTVPLTYVLAEEVSVPGILEGIGRGRTFASSGPALHLRAIGAGGREAGLGESLPASPPPLLEARCGGAPAAELRLVTSGRVRAAAPVAGEGRVAASVEPGERWCCAELWSEDGQRLLAVTSPIYLEP